MQEAIRVGDMKLLWHPAGTDCSTSHSGWYKPSGNGSDLTHLTIDCGGPPPPDDHLKDCTLAAPCLFNIR